MQTSKVGCEGVIAEAGHRTTGGVCYSVFLIALTFPNQKTGKGVRLGPHSSEAFLSLTISFSWLGSRALGGSTPRSAKGEGLGGDGLVAKPLNAGAERGGQERDWLCVWR